MMYDTKKNQDNQTHTRRHHHLELSHRAVRRTHSTVLYDEKNVLEAKAGGVFGWVCFFCVFAWGLLREVDVSFASVGGEEFVPSSSLTEKGGVAVGLDGDAGGHGPAEKGEQVDGDVRLVPVIVESLGLTARTGAGRGRRRDVDE